MGTLREATIKALPGVVGMALAFAGGKIVDAVAPPKDSRALFQDYYRAVETSNLPRTTDEADRILSGAPAPAPAPVAAPSPTGYNASGKSAMAQMTQEIDTAIASLQSAKTHTRCSLCRATLEELETDVQKKTEFIRTSSRMWHAMQDLKESGDLPANAAWATLTDAQKTQVKEHAGLTQ